MIYFREGIGEKQGRLSNNAQVCKKLLKQAQAFSASTKVKLFLFKHKSCHRIF